VADIVLLRYGNREAVFEKSARLIAIRARAGMETAMFADIIAIKAMLPSQRRAADDFEIVDMKTTDRDLEQDLDWLRARPSVAAASHVFQIEGEKGLVIPNGHLRLLFKPDIDGHRHQVVLAQYRLQRVEIRGKGEYLVRITTGSKNPIMTAAALQAEADIALAEPELIVV